MIKQHEPIQILRSQIKTANYNPRKITQEARQKLKKNLEKQGLMGGLVWNETTGNLVSGHQRLYLLDKNEGYKQAQENTDYKVWVTAVALTEQEEKEQNIFFNNQSAMGFFDEDKLKNIMKEVNFSEMTGFSKQNQISLFADTELTNDEYEKIAQQVEAQTNQYKQMTKVGENETDNFYIVLVFKNAGEKNSLLNGLNIELEDGRFINGNIFLEVLASAYGV